MNLIRDQHQPSVLNFLRQQVANQAWQITQPLHGTGQETYFASGAGRNVFIKLGARMELYQAAAQLGLAPAVIAVGNLEDGTSILIQQRIRGHKPTHQDFRWLLRQFAENIGRAHCAPVLQELLPPRSSHQYREVGLEMLAEVEQRWHVVAPGLPLPVVKSVEKDIARLQDDIDHFQGGGLAACHSDPCNANWLVTDEGRVYLLDFEAMRLDDPALDLGAILWWYYPPELRPEFLMIAGYSDESTLLERMRVRMALHTLQILLPRPGSFDRFDPEGFEADLVDFHAVLVGRENPQGYGDSE